MDEKSGISTLINRRLFQVISSGYLFGRKKNQISRNRWFRVLIKHQRITKLHVRTGGFMGSYFTSEKEIQERSYYMTGLVNLILDNHGYVSEPGKFWGSENSDYWP